MNSMFSYMLAIAFFLDELYWNMYSVNMMWDVLIKKAIGWIKVSFYQLGLSFSCSLNCSLQQRSFCRWKTSLWPAELWLITKTWASISLDGKKFLWMTASTLYMCACVCKCDLACSGSGEVETSEMEYLCEMKWRSGIVLLFLFYNNLSF
jgi:hypothetical protein